LDQHPASLIKYGNPDLSTSAPRSEGRIPGLDGIRAIAVLIVFASHYAPVVFPQYPVLVRLFPGMFGVSVFFVISGLLICTLLLREHAGAGDVSLGNFYVRRMLRLSPALLLYAAVFLVAYAVTSDEGIDVWAFVSAVTYASNYYQSAVGGELYHMPVWSLAVEEHFYLLFPAVLVAFLRGGGLRRAAWLFLGVVALTLAWRCVLAVTGWASFGQIYRNTDTRLDAPLFGVLLALAMWLAPASGLAALVRSVPGLLLGALLIGVSVLVRDEAFRMTLRYTLQGLGIALVVGHVVFGGGRLAALARRVLDNRVLRYIGVLSYSIYLWHLTLLMFLIHLYPGIGPAWAVAIGVASLGCAWLSYHLVERPCLGLRRRFGSHSTA